MTSRKALIGAAVAAAALALPSPASARIWLHADNGPRISVSGLLPREPEDVTVSAQGQGPSASYLFEDPAGIGQVDDPCLLLTPTSGSCPADGKQAMLISLGREKDTVHLDLAAAVGDGFELDRLSIGTDRAGDLVDLSGASLPATVGQARVRGGAGADLLLAGAARLDFQSGGRGDDRLIGGPGRDEQLGAEGRDRLSGKGGKDELNGGAGADVLRGGPGFDLFQGGPGVDRVVGPVTAAEAARATSVEQI